MCQVHFFRVSPSSSQKRVKGTRRQPQEKRTNSWLLFPCFVILSQISVDGSRTFAAHFVEIQRQRHSLSCWSFCKQKLFFSSCLLTFASERGIFFLQELHVQNTWLTRVPPSIRNLTQLQVLDIETSRVSFLPDGTFEGMKALQDLKIADASVSQVSDSVFSGLRKLKRLSLYKNNITSLARVSLLCCSIDPKTETAGWQLANRHFSKNKTGSIWTQ